MARDENHVELNRRTMPANGDYLVDDEILSKEQYYALVGGDSVVKRSAVPPSKVWPVDKITGHPTVPFELHQSIGTETKSLIDKAIAEYEKNTCLRFVKSHKGSRVKFTRRKLTKASPEDEICEPGDCSSHVGNQNKRYYGQMICLGRCHDRSKYGSMLHEMAHALGLYHEHQRPDRKQYIKILNPVTSWDGQKAYNDFIANYDPVGEIETYGVQYDYLSIMQYPRYPRYPGVKPTISTIDPSYRNEIGQRKELSYLDVLILNKMYGCTSKLAGMHKLQFSVSVWLKIPILASSWLHYSPQLGIKWSSDP